MTAKRNLSHEEKAEKPQRLRLYVAGSGARSLRAVQNLKHLCESALVGQYELEVVDIYQEPARAKEDQIIAIPTLINRTPGRSFRVIGDLSEEGLLRRSLGLC